MIYDSGVWKHELQKELASFNKLLLRSKKYTDYLALRIEKFFFTSSFIIRKLDESYKLSDELMSQKYKCYGYRRRNKKIVLDILNNHNVERFYDLKKEEPVLLKIRDICNYFIHSFIFSEGIDENEKLCSIFFTSDREKDRFLYNMKLEAFYSILKDVISDDIVEFEFKRPFGYNPETAKIEQKKGGKCQIRKSCRSRR